MAQIVGMAGNSADDRGTHRPSCHGEIASSTARRSCCCSRRPGQARPPYSLNGTARSIRADGSPGCCASVAIARRRISSPVSPRASTRRSMYRSQASSAPAHARSVSAEHIVDARCDRLAGVEQSLVIVIVIVIDDLQRFDARESERALLSLIMRLSPSVRWMLSTRCVRRAYRRLDFRRALLMASVLEIYNSPVRGFVTMLNSGRGHRAECCRRTSRACWGRSCRTSSARTP